MQQCVGGHGEGGGLLFSSWRKLPVQILVVVANIQMRERELRRPKWRSVPCEQQLDMGWSIFKDRGVPHTQALPRILKGNGVNILQPGRG